ncbi:hypothetical protein T492DRAFT_1044167 [Pavlovales sp. CCMP2436]|nr:hypothetical protein T492DRAFT_1044167 [Pavlovales sp. CCMP2436]
MGGEQGTVDLLDTPGGARLASASLAGRALDALLLHAQALVSADTPALVSSLVALSDTLHSARSASEGPSASAQGVGPPSGAGHAADGRHPGAPAGLVGRRAGGSFVCRGERFDEQERLGELDEDPLGDGDGSVAALVSLRAQNRQLRARLRERLGDSLGARRADGWRGGDDSEWRSSTHTADDEQLARRLAASYTHGGSFEDLGGTLEFDERSESYAEQPGWEEGAAGGTRELWEPQPPPSVLSRGGVPREMGGRGAAGTQPAQQQLQQQQRPPPQQQQQRWQQDGGAAQSPDDEEDDVELPPPPLPPKRAPGYDRAPPYPRPSDEQAPPPPGAPYYAPSPSPSDGTAPTPPPRDWQDMPSPPPPPKTTPSPPPTPTTTPSPPPPPSETPPPPQPPTPDNPSPPPPPSSSQQPATPERLPLPPPRAEPQEPQAGAGPPAHPAPEQEQGKDGMHPPPPAPDAAAGGAGEAAPPEDAEQPPPPPAISVAAARQSSAPDAELDEAPSPPDGSLDASATGLTLSASNLNLLRPQPSNRPARDSTGSRTGSRAQELL